MGFCIHGSYQNDLYLPDWCLYAYAQNVILHADMLMMVVVLNKSSFCSACNELPSFVLTFFFIFSLDWSITCMSSSVKVKFAQFASILGFRPTFFLFYNKVVGQKRDVGLVTQQCKAFSSICNYHNCGFHMSYLTQKACQQLVVYLQNTVTGDNRIKINCQILLIVS